MREGAGGYVGRGGGGRGGQTECGKEAHATGWAQRTLVRRQKNSDHPCAPHKGVANAGGEGGKKDAKTGWAQRAPCRRRGSRTATTQTHADFGNTGGRGGEVWEGEIDLGNTGVKGAVWEGACTSITAGADARSSAQARGGTSPHGGASPPPTEVSDVGSFARAEASPCRNAADAASSRRALMGGVAGVARGCGVGGVDVAGACRTCAASPGQRHSRRESREGGLELARLEAVEVGVGCWGWGWCGCCCEVAEAGSFVKAEASPRRKASEAASSRRA